MHLPHLPQPHGRLAAVLSDKLDVGPRNPLRELSALLTAEHRQFNIALVLRRGRVAKCTRGVQINGAIIEIQVIAISSMSILLHLIANWILLDALVVAMLERASRRA